MSNATFIGKQIRDFKASPQFDGYSKVVITVSEEVAYSAGTDIGRTLTLVCPWGTQEMAENILTSIRGYRYQPYTASGVLLDPAAELGDGVTIQNVYGGIFSQDTRFGGMTVSDISAPTEEEIDHEYPYIPQQERRVTKRLYQLSSEMKIQAGLISAEVSERKSATEQLQSALQLQAGEISAKVSKTGGDASSFGWILADDSWTIKSNGSDVLKATKSGVEVTGKITATSGKIGGFDIAANYLSYNNQKWGGTNTQGIYIGPEGIQLGKNFKVDNAGNLIAASGTFSGSVKAGQILYGEGNGTLPGAALSAGSIYGGSKGAIASSTISLANLTSGIGTSLGFADFANAVFSGYGTAPYMYVNSLHVEKYLYYKAYTVYPETYTFKDGDGNQRTLYYMGWRRT